MHPKEQLLHIKKKDPLKESTFILRRILSSTPEGFLASVNTNIFGNGVDDDITNAALAWQLPNTFLKLPYERNMSDNMDEKVLTKVMEWYRCNRRHARQIVLIVGEDDFKKRFGIK